MASKCYEVPNSAISENSSVEEEKIWDYEEAIDIIGNGWYTLYLVLALSIGLLGMGVDVFGFSIIVTGCACPVVMSIPWGFITDTQGRKRTLLIGLWGGFVSSFIGAFSYNWMMLAVFKVFSSMFAMQSGAYALLGESFSRKVRDFYMLVMTSVLMLDMTFYIVLGYFILQLDFVFTLGSIDFTPWRLLAIVMATPLAIGALLLHFCYESPKFLVNTGCENQALENLRMIWVKNGGKEGDYPVHRIILRDNSKARDETINIMKSVWPQIIPLFKQPLLWNTMHLFFLTAVIYSINNCWVMWMPAVMETFSSGISLNTTDGSQSLCSIISSLSTNDTIDDEVTCSHSIQFFTLLSGICHGVVFAGITLLVSKLGSRKKLLLITFLVTPMLASVGAVFNQNNLASLLLFVGMTMSNLCMGTLFAIYVDMYPTSYRGMAACLGVMVARISGVGGVNLLGSYVMAHCTLTFYTSAAILLAGIVVAAYFLPPDRPNADQTNNK